MDLAQALGLALGADPTSPGKTVAFVGAGGKTSALFELAREALRAVKGTKAPGLAQVIITTTTHIADPRREPGRPPLAVVVSPGLAAGTGTASPSPREDRARVADAPIDACVVVAAGEIPADDSTGAPAKLSGVHPSRCGELAARCRFLLVEADGSRGRAIKAPAAFEPEIPASCDLVVGVIGLDCLGAPLGEASAHRPERFGPLTGCAPGEPIGPRHVDALVRAPEGLFKGAPPKARRILLLNKADVAEKPAIEELLALLKAPGRAAPPCDRVIACSLKRREILGVIDFGQDESVSGERSD